MNKTLAATLLLLAGAARADDLRDFCADRPGKGSPACILDAGHFELEVELADHSRQRDAGGSAHVDGFGALLVRAGVTARLETQLALPGHVRDREFDAASGATGRRHGFDDVGAALRYSLANPDGDSLSIAVEPFVTAPTGRSGIGANGWTGGLIVPVSFDLGGDWQFALDPELAFAPNAARGGSHHAWTGVAGLSRDVGRGFGLSGEIWASRDADPDMASTQASADAALTWQPANHPALQFDVEGDVGLTRATPDLELHLGVAKRF